MRRLGFHLSIAGGVHNAPKEAVALGYTAFQIFTTSSRSWKNSIIEKDDALEFFTLCKENDIMPFAHIPYLCNPASSNPHVYVMSRTMLVNNMKNCDLLGIRYLVIHLGSHLGNGIGAGIENVCNMLGSVLDMPGRVNILLENGSGYKNCVGSRFSEIGKIIDNSGSARIGVCFDTCHAFAAGYNMVDTKHVEDLAKEFSSNISPSRLALIHLNDSKYQCGSGLDRHMHISHGNIGEAGLINLLNRKIFSNCPCIMELPEDHSGSHSTDMEAAKSIIKRSREMPPMPI